MSHECPDCGELCFCNGDIDDCMNNLESDIIKCSHWQQCVSAAEEDCENTVQAGKEKEG
jgi:hypothetical protein